MRQLCAETCRSARKDQRHRATRGRSRSVVGLTTPDVVIRANALLGESAPALRGRAGKSVSDCRHRGGTHRRRARGRKPPGVEHIQRLVAARFRGESRRQVGRAAGRALNQSVFRHASGGRPRCVALTRTGTVTVRDVQVEEQMMVRLEPIATVWPRRPGRYVRSAALLCMLCAAVLATAAPAQASSCTYMSGSVVATMPSATDGVGLRRVGDAIYNGGVPCGTATVHNTDMIFVHDTTSTSDGMNLVGIDLSGGPFAPGKTSEGPGGVSEIEVYLYLHRGKNTVWVTGSAGPDDIHAGITVVSSGFARGINLNAGRRAGKGLGPGRDLQGGGAPAEQARQRAGRTLRRRRRRHARRVGRRGLPHRRPSARHPDRRERQRPPRRRRRARHALRGCGQRRDRRQ